LPYEVDGRSRGLKPQSYCVHCGAVEKISSKSKNKKAKRMGYYTSILPRLGITKKGSDTANRERAGKNSRFR